MSDNRGERLITASREAVCMALFNDGPARTTNAPSDIQIEELWHHPEGYGYRMRVSSTEWEPLAEGETIPEASFEVTEVVE